MLLRRTKAVHMVTDFVERIDDVVNALERPKPSVVSSSFFQAPDGFAGTGTAPCARSDNTG